MRTIKWRPEAGRKPNKTLLQEASSLARKGTADHMVIAMSMRPNGVTQSEVVSIFNHPHRNVIKKLLQDNKVQKTILPEGSRSTRIKLIKT